MESSRFLISATSSGSGKTTITLGLLRALRNRGYSVQPFKCGPDYIDTKFHELAAGKKSINLDLFLSSADHVREIYCKHGCHADVSIAEGVMGLFDGSDKWHGSSAEIALTLDMPVILVLSPQSMAYSVAAILYGYKHFNPKIRIAGVIFNRVNTESHYRFLKDACDDVGLESLGYLPNNEALTVPSRHLGLNIDRDLLVESFAEKAACEIDKHIDLDRLLNLTRSNYVYKVNDRKAYAERWHSAVAMDEVFNFVYEENLEYLRDHGEVTFFSPMRDTALPQGVDFVYLPGGYPELFPDELSSNHSMQESLRHYIEGGGRLWAECGGMMYLSRSLTDKEGRRYEMTNIFDQDATMEGAKLTLGYRTIQLNDLHLKGHEFHYSHTESDLPSVAQQFNAKGVEVPTTLLRYKNAFAGYTHLYWAEMDDLMHIFETQQ